ncbi:hypothetical protein ABB29_12935 [Pseudoxanthomonas dokdonensis]|uniref:HTH cro/C1-type domain-containing protein n=2 Tax=Pseudoxanthomonas dokdonensis TaxID=344882 RepID=A0A0R0CF35_9GAMM|nr:hypothetical protein ABB29_12935 [Pseudoxanthomonas dokdonensis]
MQISASTIRRLRTERGWSQDQLASAAGLSLRTVQRVESQGIASMATTVSLAATYGVPLTSLHDTSCKPEPANQSGPAWSFLLGLAILSLACLSQSGHVAGPWAQAFYAINLLLVAIGLLLATPFAMQCVRRRRFAGPVLAVLGVPLVTLLAGGLVFGMLSGRLPSPALLGMGAAGAALVAMAVREMGRDGRLAGDRSSRSMPLGGAV